MAGAISEAWPGGLRRRISAGAPRKITDVQVEEAVTRTLEGVPIGATHWSTRSLAEAVGLSQRAVVRIWRAFGLQPHRTETFKLSTDPFFVEKVRDIVAVYMHPPEHAVVLSVDEKSQVQALDRTQPILPLRPGLPNSAHTITSAMAPPHYLPRWMWLPAKSSANVIVGIDIRSFYSFCICWTLACHPTWRCIDHGQLRDTQESQSDPMFARHPRYYIHSRPPAPHG